MKRLAYMKRTLPAICKYTQLLYVSMNDLGYSLRLLKQEKTVTATIQNSSNGIASYFCVPTRSVRWRLRRHRLTSVLT